MCGYVYLFILFLAMMSAFAAHVLFNEVHRAGWSLPPVLLPACQTTQPSCTTRAFLMHCLTYTAALSGPCNRKSFNIQRGCQFFTNIRLLRHFNPLKKHLFPKRALERHLFKTGVAQWQIGLRSPVGIVCIPFSHGGSDKWQPNPLDDAAETGSLGKHGFA